MKVLPEERFAMTGQRPAPKAVSDADKIVTALHSLSMSLALSKAQDAPTVEVSVPPATVTVEAAKAAPASYRFTIKRDEDGRIAEIVANPIQ